MSDERADYKAVIDINTDIFGGHDNLPTHHTYIHTYIHM